MPRPSITTSDFEELTRSLAIEIQSALIDYTMYENLAKGADAHPTVVDRSRAFWDLTIQSHLNSAILRLCRIYDQQVSSMNLAKWLKLIKCNPAWFMGKSIDIAQLDEDIKYASNHNPLVDNLTRYRGNVIAHLGENYVLNYRNTKHSFKLTYGDIKDLLKNALKILNNYARLYNGHNWSANLIGADDYQFIFRELEKVLEKYRIEHEAEIQKYGQPIGKE